MTHSRGATTIRDRRWLVLPIIALLTAGTSGFAADRAAAAGTNCAPLPNR